MATPTLGSVPATIDDAESLTGWTISSGGLDTDLFKEGSNSVLGILRTDGATGYYDITADAGAATDMTGEHVRAWINFGAVSFLDTEVNDGMEFWMHDGTNTAYWVVFGSDTYSGGWFNLVLDCDSTPDSGSFDKTIVEQWGFRFNRTAAPANRDNTYLDYFRYGDGYYATDGTSGDEIDLAGIVGQDVANGYGILIATEGIYFSYGALTVGNGATTTWFEMLGEVLVFVDAPVATGLFKLVGVGSGCRVNIEDSVLRAAGTGNATRFILDMDDSNLVSCNIAGCFINRAGELRFKSGQTITDNVISDCGQILAAGADLTGSTVKDYEGTADTSALEWDVATDPDSYLEGMTFEKGTAATHAIEFGTTSPLTMTLTDITFSGYNGADGQTDSTFYIARGSDTVTINLIGCSGNMTYKSAGATVDLVISPVTTEVTVKDIGDLSVIEDARVLLEAADGAGPLNYQESVTISRSGSTATVAHTTHGLATSDIVHIEGAVEEEYNGVYTITVTGVSEYTYTVSGTPDTPATGTITSTTALFNTLTSALGKVTDNRSWSSDQNVTGRVRKSSSGSTLYKTQPLTGIIDSSNGWTPTVLLIEDS